MPEQTPDPASGPLALTPPMGWNSWDCFGTTVTEAEVLANADHLAQHLLPHGWDTVVVDIQWYEPVTRAGGYRPVSDPVLDAHGRQLPAPNRFPSAAGGAGFAPLAAAVHERGLRFGLHVMRGIPRKAVELDLPVLGTDATARDVAVPEDDCAWNPDNVGVDLDHPAGQAWYDAQVAQFAAWGVDYLKLDDVLHPYHDRDVAAYAEAIRRSGRPVVLSLSPGRRLSLARAEHLREHAQVWRVSDDLWDRWEDVREQFQRAARWAPGQAPGGWADLDMLPLGRIGGRAERGEDRLSRLTLDEQRTLVTLWCVARSPLMFGGHLPDTPADTHALLTNDAVLEVLRSSSRNREVVRDEELVVWTARAADGGTYVAVFWLGEEPSGPLRLSGGDLGVDAPVSARDLWSGERVPLSAGAVEVEVPAHGTRLLLLAPAG
ncbi:alpha-galactosidase [Paenibacillus sp. TRM 82003]|nr:alpha-galactosidase [Kineococcus sp. TRM81007]MCI2240298.1 alpha-galactosidase [Kineococcus sp. TRM81007]MCI3927524.1 alpha-galactosidase [Paenibacillus sp. TRM 82003]